MLFETHTVPRPAEGTGVADARSHQGKRPDPQTDDLPGEVYPGGLPLFSSAASRTACRSDRNAARSSAERRAMKPVR